jgi:RHS repeat-associated protein
MPYKFTSKIQDEETGLYYFGARYYEPKLSRWINTDPAVEKYLPKVGQGDEKLPCYGGIFNSINHNLYTYSANNPIKFIDLDGEKYILPASGSNLSVEDRTIPTSINDIVAKMNTNIAFRNHFAQIAACAQTAAAIRAAIIDKQFNWNSLQKIAINIINNPNITKEISIEDAQPGDIITFSRKAGANEIATGHIATITKVHKNSVLGVYGFTIIEGHMDGPNDKLNEKFIPTMVLNKENPFGWGHGITNFFIESNLEFNSVRTWVGFPIEFNQ